MISAVLVLGLLASVNASNYLAYNPAFYSAGYAGLPWAAGYGGFYRTQYHTQANYAPLAYAAAPAYYAAAPAVATVAAPAVTAIAAPAAVEYKAAYAAAYPAYSNQYHSQNHLGEAAYGYSFPGQAHTAVRDALGGVTGSYSYLDAEGKPVQVNYRADSVNGYQVSSNVLPVAPKADLVQPVNDLVAPEPVDFTPEVKAAREEHFKAIEEAKKQPGYKAADEPKERKKRSAVYVAPAAAYAPIASPYNFGYSYSANPYFYSAPAYGYAAPYAAPYAYNYATPYAYGLAAPVVKTISTEIKPLKAVEGTPASTYKFEI